METESMNPEKARDLLEVHNMMVPAGAELTTHGMVTCLHQIAQVQGIPRTQRSLITAVAILLGEVSDNGLKSEVREIILDQLNVMAEDITSVTEGLKKSIKIEIDKHVEALTQASNAIVNGTPSATPYRDALASSAPAHINPRIIAKEGIRARQILIDCPADSIIQKLSQTDILKQFNKALTTTGAGEKEGRFRTVERLSNRGLLGEFTQDEGAKWFRSGTHADDFFTALGTIGEGANIRPRALNVIAYFVPLSFDPTDTEEILETNPGINRGDITKVRWAKPPGRRSKEQRKGHLIITLNNADTANELLLRGFHACNEKLRVGRCKKEPIRCLKCHGWNHIAAECISPSDICGTCGNREHRTNQCTDKDKFYCVSCDTDSHASWARQCPSFLRRCRIYDEKNPDNTLPFFPGPQPWTWSQEAPPQPPLPIPTQRHPTPDKRPPIPQRQYQSQLAFRPINPKHKQNPSTQPQSKNSSQTLPNPSSQETRHQSPAAEDPWFGWPQSQPTSSTVAQSVSHTI
ncbi:hypothetical protein B0H34DRAFT_784004 [Crassisporium funariophilum]|nr:hypothetical protein B0H34DRAFT_784004 [Crassisporium funariophilum]